jgi:hypothetical protein
MSAAGALRTLALCACSCMLGLASCDPASKPSSSSSPSASDASLSAVDGHADHDCEVAHPPRKPEPAVTATALSPDARQRLTTLRVSAHVGSVILRRQGSSWVTAGQNGCTVPPSRIERALDNLASLKAEPTAERPVDGNSFELQIVAQVGEERALYLDVADHGERGDLVQLVDGSTFRVRGLERELWSPNPRDWCGDP